MSSSDARSPRAGRLMRHVRAAALTAFVLPAGLGLALAAQPALAQSTTTTTTTTTTSTSTAPTPTPGTTSTSTTTTTSSSSSSTPLAATPYMGWDSYYAFGGRINEATILAQAQQLLSRGLNKLGYRYVWLDVGWWQGTRDGTGAITVNPSQWPHGIAWLASTLHSEGLLLGLYTDAGNNGCGGPNQGMYGHYAQDIDTFASWGVDALKVDFCGGVRLGLVPSQAYGQVHAAIVAATAVTKRPMLLNICNFLQPGQYMTNNPVLGSSGFQSYIFGPLVGNSWRTDTDEGVPGKVSFPSVLRNMDSDSLQPGAAGPGHWNDPDYLAPDQGMSATQFQVQMSMWAMLSAPLMISDNLATISQSSLAIVQNPNVIAIDQDPAGIQATMVASDGYAQVWDKPLSDGSRAVALLNRGFTKMTITANARGVGLGSASSYTVRNVWTQAKSTTASTFSAVVPGNGVVLLRVSRNTTPTTKARLQLAGKKHAQPRKHA